MTSVTVHDYDLQSHPVSSSRFRRSLSFILNYAGLLCLIDCIVLPVLITTMRILDVFPGLHAWESTFHAVELACVIPLGVLSVCVNYSKIKSPALLILGLAGIVAIICSHAALEGWYETALSLLAGRRKGCCHHCHDRKLLIVT